MTTVWIVTYDGSICGVYATEALASQSIRNETYADVAEEMVIERHDVRDTA